MSTSNFDLIPFAKEAVGVSLLAGTAAYVADRFLLGVPVGGGRNDAMVDATSIAVGTLIGESAHKLLDSMSWNPLEQPGSSVSGTGISNVLGPAFSGASTLVYDRFSGNGGIRKGDGGGVFSAPEQFLKGAASNFVGRFGYTSFMGPLVQLPSK